MITQKICSKCKILKNLDEFNKGSDTKLGVKSQCKVCQNQQEETRRRLLNIKPLNRYINELGHCKICKACKKLLPISEYYKMGDNYSSRCKSCHKEESARKIKEYKEDLINNNPGLYEEINKKRQEIAIQQGLNNIGKLNIFNSQRAKAKWDNIIKNNCMTCCICKKEKELTEFRMESSANIEKRGYIFYRSICNSCDAKRTAVYKNLKSQTIEGKINFLYTNLMRRVRDKQLENEITKEYLIELWYKQKGLCYYTKLPMKIGSYKEKKDLYNVNYEVVSLDRIDSTKGYTKDNTVMCCWGVNFMKQQMAIDKFLYFCKLIHENNKD